MVAAKNRKTRYAEVVGGFILNFTVIYNCNKVSERKHSYQYCPTQDMHWISSGAYRLTDLSLEDAPTRVKVAPSNGARVRERVCQFGASGVRFRIAEASRSSSCTKLRKGETSRFHNLETQRGYVMQELRSLHITSKIARVGNKAGQSNVAGDYQKKDVKLSDKRQVLNRIPHLINTCMLHRRWWQKARCSSKENLTDL